MFERLVLRKSASRLRPGGSGSPGSFPRPSPEALLGRKLFIDAQAFNIVPSTEKCSALRSPFTSGRPRSEDRNSCAISWVSRRVAVLREGRGVEHALVDRKPDEPAKQHVELQPFDQLPLRADRIEKLHKRGPQQSLRRDRGTPNSLVKRRKPRVELGQRRVGQPPHRPQRMVRGDPPLDVDVREQRPARPILAPHRSPRESPRRRQRITPQRQTPEPFRATFSAAC